MSAHPNHYELDLAALGVAAGETRTHLAGCDDCSRELARRTQRTATPGWVSELGPRRRRWRWPALVLAPALAATTALMVLTLPTTEPSGTRAKGTPTLSVFVKRGDDVQRWSGAQPLAAGDAVRLQVQPARGHLTVLDGARVLWSGPLGGEGFVPESWRLDDGALRLDVVVSERPLSAEGARDAVTTKRRDAEVWTSRLELR